MQTIDFLKTHGLDELQKRFAIKATHHEDGRVILNYDQIESYKHKTHPIVCECRGLVLDSSDWSLVARSFARFFNLGEDRASQDKFVWDNSISTNKEDGSLLIVYYRDGWHINTRGSYGDGECNYSGMTWRELAKLAGLDTSNLDKQYTYVFELCSRYNKVVRDYPFPTLYLLTMFDGEIELTHDAVQSLSAYKTPDSTMFEDVFHVQSELAKFAELDPTFEGFVLRDANNRRLKAKSDKYVALHRTVNNGAIAHPKNLVQFILDGETDEIVAYFPEIEPIILDVQEKIGKIEKELDDIWFVHQGERNRKKFAMAVKNHPFSSCLFQAKDKGVHPVEIFRSNKDLIVKKLFKD